MRLKRLARSVVLTRYAGKRVCAVRFVSMENRNAWPYVLRIVSTRLACYEIARNGGNRTAFCDTFGVLALMAAEGGREVRLGHHLLTVQLR